MTGTAKHTNLTKYRENGIVQFIDTGWMACLGVECLGRGVGRDSFGEVNKRVQNQGREMPRAG